MTARVPYRVQVRQPGEPFRTCATHEDEASAFATAGVLSAEHFEGTDLRGDRTEVRRWSAVRVLLGRTVVREWSYGQLRDDDERARCAEVQR